MFYKYVSLSLKKTIVVVELTLKYPIVWFVYLLNYTKYFDYKIR